MRRNATDGSVTRRKFLQDAAAASLLLGMTPFSLREGLFAAAAPRPGAADWPRFGYDLHNTRFNEREKTLGTQNVGRLKLKWNSTVDGPIQTTPVVIGDTLFVGTYTGSEYALETQTGERKWRMQVDNRADLSFARQGVRTSPHYADGRIYFGDNMTRVRCVDAATGNEIWQTQLSADVGSQTRSSPAIYNGKLVIGYSSNRGNAEIVCLDAETGAVSWRFPTAPEGGGGSVWASPAIDEKEHIVYNATGSVKAFVLPGHMLYTESILAHDLETGELLWHYQPRRADPFDLDFGCSPMIFDAMAPSGYRGGLVRHCVATGSKGGIFTCDRYTGQLYWKIMITNSSSTGGPILDSTAVAYNRIFAVSNSVNRKRSTSVAAALDAYTGDIMWWIPNDAMNNAPVAVANGVFYQGLMDGTLEALDVENGAKLWEYKLPSPHRGGIAIANGVLYVGSGEPSGIEEETAKANRYGVFAFSIDGA